MARREVFHIDLPTPAHESVVIPTLVLAVMALTGHLSWWWVALPVTLDVAFLALFVLTLYVVVHVHNRRARARVKRYEAFLK